MTQKYDSKINPLVAAGILVAGVVAYSLLDNFIIKSNKTSEDNHAYNCWVDASIMDEMKNSQVAPERYNHATGGIEIVLKNTYKIDYQHDNSRLVSIAQEVLREDNPRLFISSKPKYFATAPAANIRKGEFTYRTVNLDKLLEMTNEYKNE